MKRHASIQRFGLLTGILLLIGFFFPVIFGWEEGEMFFPNIMLLSQEIIPFSLKLYLVLPLFGGIACLVALAFKNHYVRAGLYIFSGFAPWLLEYWMTSEMLSMSSGMGGGLLGGGWMPAGSTIMNFLLSFGIIGMIAASFAGRVNPTSKVIPYFALAGSSMFLLGMLFPIEFTGDRMSVLLIIPFQSLAEAPLLALMFIVLEVLLVGAAVLGILWGIQHKKGVNHAFWMKTTLRIAMVYFVVAIFCVLLYQFSGRGRLDMGILVLSFIYLKALGMFIAPFFAKALGIMELLAFAKNSAPHKEPEIATNSDPVVDETIPATELPFEEGGNSAPITDPSL
jgi:hypothetical protein